MLCVYIEVVRVANDHLNYLVVEEGVSLVGASAPFAHYTHTAILLHCTQGSLSGQKDPTVYEILNINYSRKSSKSKKIQINVNIRFIYFIIYIIKQIRFG